MPASISASATSSAPFPASRRREEAVGARSPGPRRVYSRGLISLVLGRANTMSIERIGVGARMSGAVVHGDTIYLSGQVADKAAGGSVGEQTKEILGIIDGLLAKAGSDKKHLLLTTIYLVDIKNFAG